jgi:hypothetical protein
VEVSTQNSTQFTKNQYKQQKGLGVKSGFHFLQFQYYWIPTGIYPVLKYRLGTTFELVCGSPAAAAAAAHRPQPFQHTLCRN